MTDLLTRPLSWVELRHSQSGSWAQSLSLGSFTYQAELKAGPVIPKVPWMLKFGSSAKAELCVAPVSDSTGGAHAEGYKRTQAEPERAAGVKGEKRGE